MSSLLPLTLTLFFLLITQSLCLTTTFSQSIIDSHTQYLKSLKYSDDIAETYFIVNALKLLGEDFSKYKTDVCRNIASGWDGVEELYLAAQLGREFDCEIDGNSEAVGDAVSDALEQDNLVLLAYGILNDQFFDLGNDAVDDAVQRILSLVDEEYGSFFLNEQAEDGSPYYAGLALQALAAVYEKLESDETDYVNELIETLLDMSEEKDENQIHFMHLDTSISNLRTTSVLLQGLAEWSKVHHEQAVTEENVNDFANYFLQQTYVSNAEESYSLISALSILNSGDPFKKPIVVSTDDHVLYYKKGNDINIRLSDIFGNPVEDAKLYLTKAYPVGEEQNTLTSIRNQEVASVGDNMFNLKFLSAKPDPGAYILDFVVVSPSDEFQAAESTKLRVSVIVEAEIMDGTLTVGGRNYEFQQGKTLKTKFDLKEGQDLILSFSVRNSLSKKALSVQQAFAKFTHVESGRIFYSIIPKSGKSYRLDTDLSQFSNLGGDYEIEIIIGGAHIENSFKWTLGRVNIAFNGEPEIEDVRDPFEPLPEIEHQFREPEKQASQSISSAFSMAVLAPFGLFIILAFSVAGANFSGWPSGAASLATLVFFGTLGAIFVLEVYYWIGMTIFTTLYYLAGLSVVAIFSGNTVLRSKAQSRIGKLKKH